MQALLDLRVARLKLEIAHAEIAYATAALSSGYITADAAIAIYDEAMFALEGIGA